MLVKSLKIYSFANPYEMVESKLISCLASLLSVLFTQFSLFLIPLFLPTSSFFLLLPLSALLMIAVVGLGRFFKKIAGVKASAPAFVFFSISFIWVVHICVVRQVISPIYDVAFNLQVVLLIIALCGMMSVDPGFVRLDSPSHFEIYLNEVEHHKESFPVQKRVRYCNHCKEYVMGFDHHCPAFGNCIGQRNHFFFTVLLTGFVLSETSYFSCASQYTLKSQDGIGQQVTYFRCLVIGSMLFSLLQIIWQVIFIAWHVYCACFNIKTDEWINWEKYQDFHIKVCSQSDLSETAIQFKNPYDRGIVQNLKYFITTKG